MKYIKEKALDKSITKAAQFQELKPLLEIILNKSITQIDRVEFLSKTYNLSEEDIRNGNFSFSLDGKKRFAKDRIKSNVRKSTGLSFASGLPGGIAMAGTIPADIIQNLVFMIRLIRELAYIYEYEDLINQNGTVSDGLILFLGTMFEAPGAAALLRVSSSHAEKFISQETSTSKSQRDYWVPFIKSISKAVASKTIKRKGLASAASKTIPIVGGIASGGLTAFTIKIRSQSIKQRTDQRIWFKL